MITYELINYFQMFLALCVFVIYFFKLSIGKKKSTGIILVLVFVVSIILKEYLIMIDSSYQNDSDVLFDIWQNINYIFK